MPAALNHTIIWCKNKAASAGYLAGVLGLADPVPFGPFLCVETSNAVSLDFHEVEGRDGEIASQHYAFLVSEAEFDEIYGRIVAAAQEHWADPGRSRRGINRNDGGRGTYFCDPDGHLLEIITRPYGSGE